MSFSMDVKNELCKISEQNFCCKKAELYGISLFSHHLGKNGVFLNTENPEIAERFAVLCRELVGIDLHIVKRTQKDGFHYHVRSNDFAHFFKLMEFFGHQKKEVSLRINRANMENECCISAFLRGAFLSCGLVSNPEKEYNLEFNIKHQNLSGDFVPVLKEQNLIPKSTIRRNSIIIYFKESENVEDLLSMMGAMKSAFEIMDMKVYKSVRNKANRIANCETANITKTVEAAAEQTEAIRLLRKKGMLRFLSDELREVAKLRIQHPELSLRELGDKMSPKLSRSGVSHRLKKICEIAQNLSQK